MRVQIIGEKQIVDTFSTMAKANGWDVKPSNSSGDKTEFAFGLDEIAAIITMVDVAVRLTPHVVAIARSMKSGDTKKLALKSSFGMETIMLRKDMPEEEVEEQLAKLDPPKK